MRTPNVLVAVLGVSFVVCSVRGTREVREVYETGAEEPASSPWHRSEPPAYEPNPTSFRNFDILSTDELVRPQQYRLSQYYFGGRKQQLPPPSPPAAAPLSLTSAERARIIQGLLTFGAQPPDPRRLTAFPVLIVRQLRVDPFLAGPPPQSHSAAAGPTAGLLTFGPDAAPPPPPTTTPRPWWRRPPPVQLPVRPRPADYTAERLALGTSPAVARLHGPVAMGSGGVGYARLPDGSLAIGSGSIGFAQFDVLSIS